jgi:hypothetical protein
MALPGFTADSTLHGGRPYSRQYYRQRLGLVAAYHARVVASQELDPNTFCVEDCSVDVYPCYVGANGIVQWCYERICMQTCPGWTGGGGGGSGGQFEPLPEPLPA